MKLRHLAAIGLAGTLGLAACGSSSKDSGSAGTTAAPSPETNAPATSAAAGTTIRLWLNGEDTKQELVDYAIAEFKKLHPEADVQFERQQWTGIVEKLTTALSSSDSPDVVELGNTQAQAFEAAGALADLTARRPSSAGTTCCRAWSRPARTTASSSACPTTPAPASSCTGPTCSRRPGSRSRPRSTSSSRPGSSSSRTTPPRPNFSGIYFPGKYWYAALPFIWQEGGDIAVQDGGAWKGTLSSAASVKGLGMVKKIMDEASGAPKDGDESKDYVAFCNGEVGMLMGPGWKLGQILNEKDGCPAMADKVGAFALPGAAAGTTAPAFLGGSNLAISAKSEHQELALDLLKIMAGKGYQTQFAQRGHHPGAEVAARTGQRRRGGEGAGRRSLEQPVRAPPARTGPAWKRRRSFLTCWCRSPRAATCGAATQADEAITSQLNG